MNENSDAPSPEQPQEPRLSMPEGANIASHAEAHPEFYKPRSEDEHVATPAPALTLDDPALTPYSNRTAAVWIALTGGLSFALLYLLATILYSWAAFTWGDQVGGRDLYTYIQNRSLAFVSTPIYWLTSLSFFFYFSMLAVLAYRATWRVYVACGLIVAVLTYVTAIGAGLLTISAWTLTFREAISFLWRSIAFNPLILVTLMLAREIPIWFGGWIAIRARKVRDKNAARLAEVAQPTHP